MIPGRVLLIAQDVSSMLVCLETPRGILPLLEFDSMEKLKAFGESILQFCTLYGVKVPDVFIKAFEEGASGNTATGTG